MKNFLIVSYDDSDVAWLLNFFLELDILVYQGNNVYATWEYDGYPNLKLKKEQEALNQWCPVLSRKEIFKFKNNIAIEWSHAWLDGKNINRKTIIMTRDGRDTLYSQYKRENWQGKLEDMLSTRTEPFNLPYADTWALYYYLWDNIIDKENKFHVSFEQLKSNPLPEVKKVLQFLNISRSEEQIIDAIKSSDHDRAKKAELEYRKKAQNTQFKIVNRKGTPGEWKQVMKKSDLKHFQGLPNQVLKKYYYQPIENNNNQPIPFKNLNQIISQTNNIEFKQGLKQIKQSNWKQSEKNLKKALKKYKDTKQIIEIGQILIALQWLLKLHSNNYNFQNEKAEKLLNILLRSIHSLSNKTPVYYLIAEQLHFLGQGKKAKQVIELCQTNNGRSIKILARNKKYFKNRLKNSFLYPCLAFSANLKRKIVKKILNLKIDTSPGANLFKKNVVIEYANTHNIKYMVETGTFLGDMVDATKNVFQKTYSIELHKKLYKKAKKRFNKYGHINILQGDSRDHLADILKNCSRPCLFWLDAHYSGEQTAKGETETPILQELKIILTNFNDKNVILIDDARAFIGKNGYPTIENLKNFILSYNQNLNIDIRDDIIRIVIKK